MGQIEKETEKQLDVVGVPVGTSFQKRFRLFDHDDDDDDGGNSYFPLRRRNLFELYKR